MSLCLLITTCNRTPLLQHSLNRLVELTHPDEVLVVDDGGADGCRELCEQMSDRLPMRYLYHNNPGNTQCCEARNVGIKNTDAELIVTSEPEILFETDVIRQMEIGHVFWPDDVVSAGTVYYEKVNGLGHELLVGWVAPFTALYKRDWLIEVGGWDETFPDPWGWDDTDLLTRLRHSGHGQSIDRSIEVRHQWHPSRACNQAPNEAHFRAKNLESDTTFIVANRDREWGVLKP